MSQETGPLEPRRWIAPAPLVALVGWAVPGMGYLLIGQRARGLTIGITIITLFVLGILIGGVHVVDPPSFVGGSGSFVTNLRDKPWYIGQFLAGVQGVLCGYVGSRFPQSHARVMEIGTLYTAVAGMLNLMSVIDCSFRAAAAEEGNS